MWDLSQLQNPETLGILAAFVSKFTARTDIIFGKILLKSASPLLLTFIEIVVATLLLIFYVGVRPFMRNIREIEKHELLAITISAVLSAVLGPLFFLNGLAATSAINASLLVNLNPLFLSIFAVIFLHEAFTKHLIAGIALMVLGVIYLTTQGFTAGLSISNGDMLTILSAISYSLGTLIFKKYVHTDNIETLVTYRACIGSIILGIVTASMLSSNELTEIARLGGSMHYLIAYAIIGIIITYLLHYYALEHTTLTNNAIFTLASPIIGVAYARIFLNEQITGIHIISGSIIIAGLVVTKLHLIERALLYAKLKLRHEHTN